MDCVHCIIIAPASALKFFQLLPSLLFPTLLCTLYTQVHVGSLLSLLHTTPYTHQDESAAVCIHISRGGLVVLAQHVNEYQECLFFKPQSHSCGRLPPFSQRERENGLDIVRATAVARFPVFVAFYFGFGDAMGVGRA